MQNILVLNCGSSSLKLKVISLNSGITHVDIHLNHTDRKKFRYEDALERAIDELNSHISKEFVAIDLIAHRIVHGGEKFFMPVLITDNIIREIESLTPLAPLHLPGNISGIKMCKDIYPHIQQVAVFDTAFHKDMPSYAYLYPLPKGWNSLHGVRKFGFHGASHSYLMNAAANAINKPVDSLNLITMHLGNGVSLCAISKGKSIDTTMGFTPVAGVMMGTRCGDIDPIIPLFIMDRTNTSLDEMKVALNAKSGLEAVCGSHDMREILVRRNIGDADAILAVDMFVYRIRKALGEFMVVLGHVDAIIFSGGIGENSAEVRSLCCEGLEPLGIEIDPNRNTRHPLKEQAKISSKKSLIDVFVIKTNEEHQIAREAVDCINSR